MRSVFATVSGGLEELLKTELTQLGATSCQIKLGGIQFDASDGVLYKTLLWSRLASRILLTIAEFDIYNEQDLYQQSYIIPWPAILKENASFSVYFQGTNTIIQNSQFAALRINDGIVARFRATKNYRPKVDKHHPDVRIIAKLWGHRIRLYFDLSGDRLRQRKYRIRGGHASLKETLAAALVIRSGWQKETPLIDPFCGSGTLLIEAALQAADIAPGLTRQHYGFFYWQGYDTLYWEKVVSEAKLTRDRAPLPTQPLFFGFDKDAEAIKIAQENAKRAGVEKWIEFRQQDISQLEDPSPGLTGTILTNPPYGERLENESSLIAVYTQLGERVQDCFSGWALSVFSAAPFLLGCLHLRAAKQFKIKNGDLDAIQKNYALLPRTVVPVAGEVSVSAESFANRLKKNAQKIVPWAKKQDLEAYRLYDADLPEYNAAIDCYGDYIVIQEYMPPGTIDAQKARARLFDLINATVKTLNKTADKVILKKRQKQKGSLQYQALDQKKDFFLVKEYDAQFWVNLTDYLDTGLFLDHRLVRKKLGEMARDKGFLNLFAYTGTASVCAALGGARSTTTVDMSRTYLAWAERNFKQNGIFGKKHQLIQDDCLRYLEKCENRFDLIFIDPPTFSNSKKMVTTLDIQRDHLLLLKKGKRLLYPGGKIVFSNNKRGFKIDTDGISALGLACTNITDNTIPLDFLRNKQIHHCFVLTAIEQ